MKTQSVSLGYHVPLEKPWRGLFISRSDECHISQLFQRESQSQLIVIPSLLDSSSSSSSTSKAPMGTLLHLTNPQNPLDPPHAVIRSRILSIALSAKSLVIGFDGTGNISKVTVFSAVTNRCGRECDDLSLNASICFWRR